MTEDTRIARPSVKIAMISSFAALYILLSIVSPFIPAIGLPEIKIRLEASFASIFGIVLGPSLGASAAFIGSVGALLLHGASLFDLIFILNPAFNALIIGLIFRKKWKAAFAIFVLTVLAFLLTPVCNPILEYWFVGLLATFDKILALILIIPANLILNLRKKSSEGSVGSLSLSFLLIFLTAFIGNQADAALGNDIFALPAVYEGIFSLPLEVTRWLFTVSPFIYPAIRVIQAFVAASLGLPLMMALKRLKIYGAASPL